MTRVLVTGGAGYLGSTLVPMLLDRGCEVAVVDSFMYGQDSLSAVCHDRRFTLRRGDVRNLELMKPLVARADVIIPLAALVGAPLCDRDPLAATSTNKQAIVDMLPMLSPSQRVILPITNSGYGVGETGKFCTEDTPLRPVIHAGSFIGANVPVWDIADKFGDTNLLVTNMDQGRDLAKCMASNNVALMRGHGFASAGRSLIEVVRMSVYLPRNARALLHAKQLGGEIKYLRQGEIDARNRGYSPYSTETWRAWEFWATKAGCAHMLTKPDHGHEHKKS